MRSWCRTSVALLLLSVASSITMAKADVTTPEFDLCIKKSSGVTSEMMNCVDVETKRQDEKLNQSLLASLKPARKTQLVDAQRAWLKYRELNCAFYDDGSGGTAAGLAANDCIMTMTAKRAAELEYLMPNQ